MKSLIVFALASVALVNVAGCPAGDPWIAGAPRARVQTNQGEFVIELLPEAAPATVANFRQYAAEGFYDGTLFHRVIPNFVIQGGGMLPGLIGKETRPPVPSEALNGLKNLRGTVAMARAGDPNSATSQFFVNLADNSMLDGTLSAPGYAVFGVVVEGLDVVDAIGAVPTTTAGVYRDVPSQDVVIERVALEDGARELTPEWASYISSYQASAATYLREMELQIVTAALEALLY